MGEEVQRLRKELEEMDDRCQQAAKAGLDLVHQNVELQGRLEEQRVDMTNALEALEQDKYSLQKEVELKGRMLESLQSDYDYVKSQQSQQLQRQLDHLERNHRLVLNELNNTVVRLQSELEESQLSERQLSHKLEVQTDVLKSKVEEIRALNEQTQVSKSSEVMEGEIRRMELENAKVELERSLQESQYRQQQMELTNSSLQRQLQRVSEEKEETGKQAVSWFNALEKSREAKQDLQIQLDQVLQQAQDPNSKGNSLFAELEDKRAQMERRLISMKVQYQSLQKQHAFSKQQLHRMKLQIANLMQLQSSRTDPAQLERLQSMLAEKNGEIQHLITKLQTLEKEEVTWKAQLSCPAPAYGGDGQDPTYYADLLQMKLNNSVKASERQADELSLQRMKCLSESQRALQLERKLFSSERLLKQAQGDKLKLQLRVEELQEKYEPTEAKEECIRKRKREKLPVDITPSSEVTSVNVEPIVAIAMDVPNSRTADADACTIALPDNSTQGLSRETKVKGSVPDPQTTKSVTISEDVPVVIPSSSLTECEVNKEEEEIQQQTKREAERRKKQRTVEVIHVRAKDTMESQCAQQ